MEAVAKHDFSATAEDELSFRKNQILKVRILAECIFVPPVVARYPFPSPALVPMLPVKKGQIAGSQQHRIQSGY